MVKLDHSGGYAYEREVFGNIGVYQATLAIIEQEWRDESLMKDDKAYPG